MSDATLDDRGRLTLPKGLRERYGDHYQIVELHDGIKLIPIAENPLEALRDEFDDVEKTADELREEARDAALDEAGR
ncbi:AbrB/MazE/SpoVT family DNA-binding domain-containing protein [Natrinema sp. H-ect4]|uniref:AbrB/MazE/SpoVT family DNA-binding domain-containing protein n=1 Tax=Natrinema sp. H-ect4 TaxID=3242699 RepID=UPI0035A880F5